MQKTLILLLFMVCLLGVTLNGQTVSSKRGVGYDLNNSRDAKVLASGLSWFYNWSEQPASNLRGSFEGYGLDYAPMTWGSGFNESVLRSFLSDHPNVKYLLAFNEPNFQSQSNLTPSQVAALWPTLEQIAEDYNLELVGPALNYSGDPVAENGTTYNDPVVFYDDFFELYPTAKVDYIGIHYYVYDASTLDYHISRLYKYGKKIWLTEFNMDNGTDETADQQRDYAVQSVHYLENNPNIFRYAWFIGRNPDYPTINLLDEGYGKLTALGYVYTQMSSYDSSYYHASEVTIPAEQYLNMNGVSVCNLSTDISDVYVGYVDGEDWLEYNIEVPEDGTYEIALRASSPQDASFRVTSTEGESAVIEIPNTGGWESWVWTSNRMELQKGKTILRFKARTSNINLDELKVSKVNVTATSNVEESLAKPYALLRTESQVVMQSNQSMTVNVYSLSGAFLHSEVGNQVSFNKSSASNLWIMQVGVEGKSYFEKIF